MQYPFPYKNTSASTDIITNGDFVIVNTGTLDVTGNATISGSTTTSQLIVTGTATSAGWDGTGNLNGDLFSSQTNTSFGTSATSMYRMFNADDDTFDIAMASRLNTVYQGQGVIKTARSIILNTTAPGRTITLATNTIPRLTVSDAGVSFPTAIPISSGGTGLTTVGSAGQALISNGTSLSYGNVVTSVEATVPSFLSVSGSPITSTGTLAIGYSGTPLPVLNGGTGVTSSTGANSVMLRDANQNAVCNILVQATQTITTSATTVDLTVSSPGTTIFTGSANQTVKMAAGNTYTINSIYRINNNSTGTVTVNANNNALIGILPAGSYGVLTVIGNGGTPTSWDLVENVPAGTSWGTALLNTGSSIQTSGQLRSTVVTGTPPLVVSSTSNVANLNASFINGVGFASPAINTAVALNASAQFISISNTGTGNNVLATSPTVSGLTATGTTTLTTVNGSDSYTINQPGSASSNGFLVFQNGLSAGNNLNVLVGGQNNGSGNGILHQFRYQGNDNVSNDYRIVLEGKATPEVVWRNTGVLAISGNTTINGTISPSGYTGVNTSFNTSQLDIGYDLTNYRKVVIDVFIRHSNTGGTMTLGTTAGIPGETYMILTSRLGTTTSYTDGTIEPNPASGNVEGALTITVNRPVTPTSGFVTVNTVGQYYNSADGPASPSHYMTYAQSFSSTLRFIRSSGAISGSYTITNYT